MIQSGRGGIRTHGSQTDKAEFESDALMSCDRAKEILLTILQRLARVDCEFGRMKLRALNVEGRTPDPEILLCCSHLCGVKRLPGIPSTFPVLFLGPTLRF